MSSPNSPSVPPLIRDSHPALPSVARFREHKYAEGFFLICDPAGDYSIISSGEVTSTRGNRAGISVALVTTLICAIWAAINATSLGWGIALFVMGAAGGLFIGGIIGAGIMGVTGSLHRKSDQRKGRDISFKITPDSGQPWRLCSIVAKLAQVKSWADGTVDKTRRAPSILWSAVGRSMVNIQPFGRWLMGDLRLRRGQSAGVGSPLW